MPQRSEPSPALSDDYDGTFYIREPVVNHHHYTLDGSSVLFHDHDGPGNFFHPDDSAHYHNARISYGTEERIYDDVIYGLAHYDDDHVSVRGDGGKYIVFPDDNESVDFDLTDYRGS